MRVEEAIEGYAPSTKFPYMYVPRAVDDQLWKTFMDWWADAGKRIGRISLESDHGRGNSFLLEYFCNRIASDQNLNSQARVIRTDADDNAVNDGRPKDLPTIAGAIFEEHNKIKPSWSRRLVRWLSRRRMARITLMFAGGFAILSILSIIHELGWQLQPFSAESWNKLVRGAQDHWLEIVKDLLYAFIVPLAYELVKWGMGNLDEGKEASETERERVERLESYRDNGPSVLDGMQELCRGKSALVLIIDNAYSLTPPDRALLRRFEDPSFASSTDKRGGVRRFTAFLRVIVITLDFPQIDPDRSPLVRKVLPVQPFTRVELRQIVEHSQSSKSSSDKSEWLVDMAEQSVKAVCFEKTFELRQQLAEEFRHPERIRIPGKLGFRDLMALCAARPQPSPTARDLIELVNNLDLAAFGLERPFDVERLVGDFCSKSSSLFHVEDVVIHFDAAACRILRNWLEEDSEGKPYLLRAHYFWFAELTREFDFATIPVQHTFVRSQHVKIRQAAWHLTKLGTLLSNEPTVDSEGTASEDSQRKSQRANPERLAEFLEKASRLTDVARLRLRHQAAATLLLASVFSRSEGEINHARRQVEDALAWLPSEEAAEPDWLSFAVRLLWSSYWILFDDGIRARLEAVIRENPSVKTYPSWIVHQQYEDLLKGNLQSSANPPHMPLDDRDLENVRSLTRVLRFIRLSHGFTTEGLGDPEIAIPEPRPGGDAVWAEFMLREFDARGHICRRNWKQAEAALSSIREQLDTTPREAEPIHLQLNRIYQSARYHHLLLEYWKARLDEIGQLPALRQDQDRTELEHWLAQRSSATQLYSHSPQESIFDQAQTDYRNALQIAAWLSFRSVLLDAGFNLGCLLLDFTSDETKTRYASWWNEWEGFFEASLRIEKYTSFQLYSPEIFRRRSEFFGAADKSAAISESFNTLQSVRKAGYPDAVVLDWHSRTGGLLTNHAQSQEDFVRSSQLHEAWARELAVLPQAERYRTFKKSLALERAYALDFAAQARRQAEDLKRAEELNAEADQLCRDAAAGEHGEDPETVRDLGIGIRLQHAWIVSENIDRRAEYGSLVRTIWKDLEPGCEHCANVLGCLVRIELEEGLLSEPWQPSNGTAASTDPDNSRFSLPERWFSGADALLIENRFQYRFYQMLNLVSPTHHHPNVEMLYVLGRLSGWHGQEHFGESLVGIALIELEYGYLAQTHLEGDHVETDHKGQRATLIDLLEAVARVFSSLGDAEEQIHSYRLLMQFEPTIDRFRDAYIQALAKHRQFLDRELRARALEHVDWIGAARRLDYYFSVLVNQDLFKARIAEQIRRSGQSVEDFQSALEHLAEALPQARALFASGRYRECLAILDPALGFIRHGWVVMIHLESLDLWLRCAARIFQTAGSGPAEIEKYSRHASLLREMSLRYITQFGLSIDDPIIQQLAVQLFETLRDAVPEAPNVAGILPDTIR